MDCKVKKELKRSNKAKSIVSSKYTGLGDNFPHLYISGEIKIFHYSTLPQDLFRNSLPLNTSSTPPLIYRYSVYTRMKFAKAFSWFTTSTATEIYDRHILNKN